MTPQDQQNSIEKQIDHWRNYLGRRQEIHSVDIAELEDHLREQIASLTGMGLASDEAFLVGIKRIGNIDALSLEFAREHSDRLWKQLALAAPGSGESRPPVVSHAITALCLALAAAAAVKIPALFGIRIDKSDPFYVRNLCFFVLPLLTGWFARKRRLSFGVIRWLSLAFFWAAIFANAYPYAPHGSTEALTALHLPIALWLIMGVAYAGRRWRDTGGRMDFIRFSGELFIYYALIALGGLVLIAFIVTIFKSIGVSVEAFLTLWLVPCGAAGAMIIAAWLVEAKQNVIENMAPVLTRVFTPLFAAVLIVFLGALVYTGRGIDIKREVLIAFDFLLLMVLGLLLYSISARDPQTPANFFDVLQVLLVISALLADGLALWAIAARISEFGFSANRVAALGENVILLINLAGSAVLYIRFLRGRGEFARLENWQTNYLPVFAVWSAAVVMIFPPVFRYT